MSTLHLATDPRVLADALAANLDRQAKTGDFFTPARIVVPNRFLRKWLRLHLARKLGVAINLEFQILEEALWGLLRETDPIQSATPPEVIDDNLYRLLVLSVLLHDRDPHLAPLERYLQREGPDLSRLSCRRAWRLADRFGLLIRDYEYARQDALIQPWLVRSLGLASASRFHQTMERAQRALFLAITREPDGKRALLNRLGEKTYKTFPQYAMERMTSTEKPTCPGGTIHFVGFTEVCDLHARAVAWLGNCFDVQFYHLNTMTSRLPSPLNAEVLSEFTQAFRDGAFIDGIDRGRELLYAWGRAGVESLELLKPLFASNAFQVEVLQPSTAPKRSPKGGESVLSRLRHHLLGHKTAKTRLPQDTSIQIVGCPGAASEAETVYNSIVQNLQNDPSLRQTDIAVLATDMAKYRAVLQAVFERPPKRVQYNMVDFNAAAASTFGQALVGMLDLALESFTRSRVFAVLLNPCFLARLGVDRTQAMSWLDWAENLGIYQGWDADEKAQQGFAPSPLYSWRLGLQRLRLGRYMDISPEEASDPAPRFGHVIPFADLGSTERDHLDAFCRAVEGLLPALARLRISRLTGVRWAQVLRRLVEEFLEVPADRAEETQVRAALLHGIEALPQWDKLADAGTLPLALVREFVQSQLEMLQGNRGEYLVGGVTIAELQPMRATPFAIVYVLGLGEDLFPGSNSLSSFDLRGADRRNGDIRPAEARLYDFLATVLSADKKLYLLHNNRDLRRDQVLLPAVPLVQLTRFLSDHVLPSEFQPVKMPQRADDIRYLDPAHQPAFQDVLVQTETADRSLAILGAIQEERLTLDATQQAEWARQCQALQQIFTIPAAPVEAIAAADTVSVIELQRFLRLPAEAALRRHLRVEEEDELSMEDDEPLVTTQQAAYFLIRQTIQQIILAATESSVDAVLADWQERFAQTYADARLRSRAPEAAFGEIDQAVLVADLQERLLGQGQIETFLREHADRTFCGPVLLGEAMTPLGAKLHFPALRIAGNAKETRVVGWTNFAWHSPGRFEILIVSNSSKIEGDKINLPMIEPVLFYLALLANAEANSDGIPAQAWLAQREFQLHIAHTSGIQTWTYPAGSVTPTEAVAYLTELTRDFLQPDQFDLLPFEVLRENVELRRAFNEAGGLQISPENYRNLLVESLEEARENAFGPFQIPLLVEMIGAEAPADALAKVQRRFRLLDRGPARFRQMPTPIRKRKK